MTVGFICNIPVQLSHLPAGIVIVFKPKSKFNPCWQMRQLYTYVADESTLRLVEDGMSAGLTNKKKASEYSVLYHVFARKQCYLCSALRHKSYLTLPNTALCYIASRFTLPRNFCARAIQSSCYRPKKVRIVQIGDTSMKLSQILKGPKGNIF